MKSYIFKSLTLIFILGIVIFNTKPASANHAHGMSPRDGYVTTPTGAPVAGAKVIEYSNTCPSPELAPFLIPGCPIPATCYGERSTFTDANGYYRLEPMTPAVDPNNKCSFNAWWLFNCWNPAVFIKAEWPGQSQASQNLIINEVNAAEDKTCSIPVQHTANNVVETITVPIACEPPPACNTACQNSSQCALGGDGCTACVEGICKPPPACNTACERDGQCIGAKDGCTSCLPSDTGTGKVCRPPAACNVACQRDDQCAGSKDGCTSCLGGVCKKPPACNESCTNSAECAKSGSNCTECLPGDTGTGTVCRPAAACNVACTKDSQCAGARDGCTVCMGGVCKPPPSCGTACTTKADCANPKDGCSECLEGTCTDYSDNMCKCDGIVADMQYPSNSFKFEAFGKVEGVDIKKAEIADITFRMTKDNQVIAKSNPITPEIVENSAAKMRFKAAWQTTPPAVDKNATYRVFADVRCKPKKIVASAAELANASMVSVPDQATAVEPVNKLPVPKGTQLLADAINQISKLFGYGNDLITKEALAQFNQTSPAPNQAGNQLQLQTLNFIKMMDTDNCRFVMWKFDETLF